MVKAIPMTPPIAPETIAFRGASTRSAVGNEGSAVTVRIHAGQSEYTSGIGGRPEPGGTKLKTTTRSKPRAAKLSRNLNGVERRRCNPVGVFLMP